MDAPFNTAETDRLLTTTRAVRKRLDLERPVPREIITECIRLSQQAPTGSNSQSWRWVVVTDPELRRRLGELYRAGGAEYLRAAGERLAGADPQLGRVIDSASWLAEHIEEVPVHVIPCVKGRPPDGTPVVALAGLYGSIFPAVWSFQLALRSRGLGSCLTTFHLAREREAAELLGIPEDVLQVGLLPVAWTRGTEFRPAARPPVERIIHWDRWGNKLPEAAGG